MSQARPGGAIRRTRCLDSAAPGREYRPICSDTRAAMSLSPS